MLTPHPWPFSILAAISRAGLRSLYELQRQAGRARWNLALCCANSSGTDSLICSAQGKRRRREMRVTADGDRVLRTDRSTCLQNYPDVESTLRAAAVAVSWEGSRSPWGTC